MLRRASSSISGLNVEQYYRRSRILHNHQAVKGCGTLCTFDRQIGFDEERCSIFMQPVDGNGPAWRQRHALCADRFALYPPSLGR